MNGSLRIYIYFTEFSLITHCNGAAIYIVKLPQHISPPKAKKANRQTKALYKIDKSVVPSDQYHGPAYRLVKHEYV